MKKEKEISAKNPFRVPDDYFETLTERMISLSVIEGEEKNVRKKRELYDTVRPYLALAAVMTGFALITAGIVRVVSDQEGNLLAGYRTRTVIREMITEEIEITTLENELAEYMSGNTSADNAEDDFYESMVIENIEETDIYDL